MRLPRMTTRRWAGVVAAVATLCWISLYLQRELSRPLIGFVGHNGVHWTRRMTDKEIAETVETDWKVVSAGFHKRGLDQARNCKYDEAIDGFTEAIRFNPNVADYFIDRGNAWAAKGDQEKARADWRQADGLRRKP